MKIKLNTIEEIMGFCRIASNFASDVTVRHGKYAVDGKSLMGLISLNLSETLDVNFEEKDNETEKEFKEAVSALGVIVGGN